MAPVTNTVLNCFMSISYIDVMTVWCQCIMLRIVLKEIGRSIRAFHSTDLPLATSGDELEAFDSEPNRLLKDTMI